MPWMEADRVEVLPIGKALCLFRPANQATSLVNASAAEIFRRLAEGRSSSVIANELVEQTAVPADLAARDVSALEASFRSSGLIGPLARTLAVSPSAAAPSASARSALDQAGSPRYAIAGGPSAAVAINDPMLAALAAAALAPLRCDRAESEDAVRIHAARSAGGIVVRYGGDVIVAGANLAVARRAVLQAALLAMTGKDAVAAILHASAVTVGGRALLLGGATGSGKTTLLLALLASGAHYIADDFTPLRQESAAVSAFPVAVSVKSGSWELARGHFPTIGAAPEFALGPRRVRYLDVSRHRQGGAENIAVGSILFPRFQPGAMTRLTSLEADEALRLLMQSGSAPVGARPSMRALVELAGSVPAYSLAYSDTGEAVARARAIMGSAR